MTLFYEERNSRIIRKKTKKKVWKCKYNSILSVLRELERRKSLGYPVRTKDISRGTFPDRGLLNAANRYGVNLTNKNSCYYGHKLKLASIAGLKFTIKNCLICTKLGK